MAILFRRTLVLYFGLVLSGVLLFNYLIRTIATKAVWQVVLVILMIGWIFLSLFIATKYAVKLNQKINELCTEECDPFQYIEAYEKLLKRRIGKARTYVLLNVSTGYLCAGDLYKAKQVLDSIVTFPNNRAVLIYKFIYYNNLFSYFLGVDDNANAEIMLDHMLTTLKNKKFPKRHYDRMHDLYVNKQYNLNMAKGNYDGAEGFFLKQYNGEQSKLNKVTAKYHLGKIYLHFNRIEEALLAFEYVVENGNKDCYVERAIEFIKEYESKVHAL